MTDQTLLTEKCEPGVLLKAETGEMETVMLTAEKQNMDPEFGGTQMRVSCWLHLRRPQCKVSAWPQLPGPQVGSSCRSGLRRPDSGS